MLRRSSRELRRMAYIPARGIPRCITSTPLSVRLVTTSSDKPLVRLSNAAFPHLHSDSAPLSLTIPNTSDELWAVVSPTSSSGAGAKLLSSITSALAGRTRPRQTINDDTRSHPSVHPFAASDVTKIGIASFAKQDSSSGGGANEFSDFSKRYGALREEDFVTLYERIMFDQGFEVGRVAELRIVPDKLSSSEADVDVQRDAHTTKAHIERLAPLLGLLKPVPGTGPTGPVLLHQPIISLSNGQTRRASICGALVDLARRGSDQGTNALTTLLVLVQPFSGLDEPSRDELTEVLSSLHAKGMPRVLLVLRRQDELPANVTHVIDIDDHGRVWAGSRDEWHGSRAERPKGVEGIRQNAADGVGVGVGQDVAKLRDVSVRYGETTVLNRVNLHVKQGTRLIVKGANGSGKTTLLALLSGSHPQSYSFGDDAYTLFGRPRSASANATRLLNKRIGYFGPDLLAAFPRRGLETGGLTIGQAIASGFEGVFSRITTTERQRTRIRQLVPLFADCFGFRDERTAAAAEQNNIDALLSLPFIALNPGSQALTLFLRAIINQPELLILDEPFQGMDAQQNARIRQYIDASTTTNSTSAEDPFAVGATEAERREDAEKRRTAAVILVSHYVNEWPDRMGEFLLLDEGNVVESV